MHLGAKLSLDPLQIPLPGGVMSGFAAFDLADGLPALMAGSRLELALSLPKDPLTDYLCQPLRDRLYRDALLGGHPPDEQAIERQSWVLGVRRVGALVGQGLLERQGDRSAIHLIYENGALTVNDRPGELSTVLGLFLPGLGR